MSAISNKLTLVTVLVKYSSKKINIIHKALYYIRASRYIFLFYFLALPNSRNQENPFWVVRMLLLDHWRWEFRGEILDPIFKGFRKICSMLHAMVTDSKVIDPTPTQTQRKRSASYRLTYTIYVVSMTGSQSSHHRMTNNEIVFSSCSTSRKRYRVCTTIVNQLRWWRGKIIRIVFKIWIYYDEFKWYI